MPSSFEEASPTTRRACLARSTGSFREPAKRSFEATAKTCRFVARGSYPRGSASSPADLRPLQTTAPTRRSERGDHLAGCQAREARARSPSRHRVENEVTPQSAYPDSSCIQRNPSAYLAKRSCESSANPAECPSKFGANPARRPLKVDASPARNPFDFKQRFTRSMYIL